MGEGVGDVEVAQCIFHKVRYLFFWKHRSTCHVNQCFFIIIIIIIFFFLPRTASWDILFWKKYTLGHRYWWILEHIWCASIAWKCDTLYTFFRTCQCYPETHNTGTQNWSSTVLFNICVPVSQAWSTLFPFLHSCSLRLCIASVWFLSLPCRTFGRVLYLSCFFFLSFCHSFWLITLTCLDGFLPYLVTTTYTLTATCHVTSMGPKVT